MGKGYKKKDLREIDYEKGRREARLGISTRGKAMSVVKEKDARGLTHIPAKRILDSKGVWQEVDFGKWRNEVINNPTGPTAQRAKAAKDPDLKRIDIDVIKLDHGKSSKSGEPSEVPTPHAHPTRTVDLSGMAAELQKRPGFRAAEAGKESKQKAFLEQRRKEKEDAKKNKK